MGTISQMAEKCQKCRDRYKCNHKRMEMCAYIDEPKSTASNSISNETNASVFNVGGAMSMSVVDIAKEIEKSISKSISMCFGW